MNKYLNIFNSYSKDEKNYQLENDLTRALAICLQEDKLLLHEVLKQIFSDTKYYNSLFDEYSKENRLNIEIQKEVSALQNFEHFFAVSLTSSKLSVSDFYDKNNHEVGKRICDLVITINNIVIIIEVKRDDTDCTSQLYNQIFNALKETGITKITKDTSNVTPVDLNWNKLMEIVVNINNYHQTTNYKNRFLDDFVEYIREHNYNWLPETSISSLTSDNKDAIQRRIKTAVSNTDIAPLDSNRIGFKFPLPYADEIIFTINDSGDLIAAIYPGNTKSQGYHIFNNADTPKFKKEITIQGNTYDVNKAYHVKFSSFQRYFAGLWFAHEELQNELYNKTNFFKFSGRKKKGQDWDELEMLFDESFVKDYQWREYCKWNEKIIGSGKTQFDISFGYELR